MINERINNHLFIPLLILFLLLQLTFIPQLFSGIVAPDIVLILLLAASFLYRSPDIFYVVFLCGFALDLFSGLYFGPTIISLLFSVFVSACLGRYFLKEMQSLNLLLIVFGGVIVYNVIYFVLINVGSPERIFIGLNYMFFVTLFNIAYTMLIIYPLMRLISYKK